MNISIICLLVSMRQRRCRTYLLDWNRRRAAAAVFVSWHTDVSRILGSLLAGYLFGVFIFANMDKHGKIISMHKYGV